MSTEIKISHSVINKVLELMHILGAEEQNMQKMLPWGALILVCFSLLLQLETKP